MKLRSCGTNSLPPMLKLKEYLRRSYPFLKEFLKKRILSKLLGPAVGGPKFFALSLAVEYLLSKLLKPLYFWSVRKVTSIFKRKDINKKVENIEKAKTESEFDSAVDDL